MDEKWTPSTEQVRSHYVFNQRDEWQPARGESFDRWLAEHDADVAAKAIESAAAEAYEVKITGQNNERRSEQRPVHAKATREHLQARAAAIRSEGASDE